MIFWEFFWGHSPRPPYWGGAMAPLPRPHPLGAPAFHTSAPRSGLGTLRSLRRRAPQIFAPLPVIRYLAMPLGIERVKVVMTWPRACMGVCLCLHRAASSIYQFMICKRLIEHETLPPLLIRNVIPLCMAQYEKLFSTTRFYSALCYWYNSSDCLIMSCCYSSSLLANRHVNCSAIHMCLMVFFILLYQDVFHEIIIYVILSEVDLLSFFEQPCNGGRCLLVAK